MLFSYPLYTTTYLPLLQLDRKGQTAQLVQQHVHCLGNTRLGQVVAFDDGLVSLGTTHHVIRLDGQDLLQDIGGAESFERPNLHLTETLTAELRLTAERLLRDSE